MERRGPFRTQEYLIMDIKDILKSYAEILAIKIEQLQMLHVGLKTTPIK